MESDFIKLSIIRFIVCFIIFLINIKVRIFTENDNGYFFYWIITFVLIVLYFEGIEPLLKKYFT
jgi:hypothetical protein